MNGHTRRLRLGLMLAAVTTAALVASAVGVSANGTATATDPEALSQELASCGSSAAATPTGRSCATDVGTQAARGQYDAVTAQDFATAQRFSDVKAAAMAFLFTPGSVHPTPQEVSEQLDRAAGVAPAASLSSNEKARRRVHRENASQIICAPTTGLNSGSGHASETARLDCYYDVIGGGRAIVSAVSSYGRLWRLSGSWYVESSHHSSCVETTGCIDIHTAYNATGYFQGEGQHYVTFPPGWGGNTYAEAWSKVCYIQTGTIQYCS